MISGYRLYQCAAPPVLRHSQSSCSASDFIAQRLVGDLIFANRSSINKNFYLAVGAGSCQCYSDRFGYCAPSKKSRSYFTATKSIGDLIITAETSEKPQKEFRKGAQSTCIGTMSRCYLRSLHNHLACIMPVVSLTSLREESCPNPSLSNRSACPVCEQEDKDD